MAISFDDFKKVELRVGKILSAERVEGSEKLLKLAVDLGEKDEVGLPAGRVGAMKPRQIIAGIGTVYAPEQLIGKEIVVVANLEPRKLMGLESQGMLLAASGFDKLTTGGEAGPIILTPEREVPPGSLVS